jgi:spermidine synthase
MMTAVMTLVLLAMAFISGAASLIYQIVWMRRLALVFGHTTLATSTVLAAFLAGLAIGTFLWGRLADRRPQSTLMIFALLEAVTGLYGFASLWIFKGVEAVYLAAYPSLADRTSLFAALQFLLCAIAIMPPVVLMGGSLPLLTHRMKNEVDEIARKAGAVYGWNTLGAAAGAAFTTYKLLPDLGMTLTVILAGTLNLVVGAAAMGLRSLQRESARSLGTEDLNQPAKIDVLLLLAFALSGFAAITFEVVWARLLAMVMGSSVYAFGTLVVVVLIGLGAGSAIYGRTLRTRETHRRTFGKLEGFIALAAALSLITLPYIPGWFLRYFPVFREAFHLQVAAHFAVAAIVALIPSLLFGATFPAVIGSLGSSTTARIGRVIGTTYAANTLGTVAGAWLAGFVLIPSIGVRATMLSGIVAGVVAGLLVWWSSREPKLQRLPALGPAVVALLLILAIPSWPREVFAAGIGFFAPRYGNGETLDEIVGQMQLLYYRDGVSATISVDRTGEALFYRSNGKTDASTQPGDIANQMLLGHIPMLLHPAPQDVFVLGLGTGMTAAAVARYPVKTIDIVEAEPAGVEAARFFDNHTNDVLDDPRVHLMIGDGRNRLLADEKEYDVIISDPSDLWVAGIGSLATLEYYQTVAARLRTGGVFAQWVHTHTLLPEDFDLLVATFHAAFPRTRIWMSAQGDLIFVGTREPADWDYGRLKQHFENTDNVADDLKSIGFWTPYALFAAHVLGEAETDALVRNVVGIYTDDHPVLEFRTPRSLYVDTTPMIVQELDRFRQENPPAIQGFDPQHDLDAEGTYLFGFASASLGRSDLGITYMQRSTTMAPDHPLFLVGLANQYRLGGRLADAQAAYEKALTLDLNNVEALLSLGEIRLDAGQIEWTRLLAQRALRLAPQNARAHALVDRLQEAER